MRRMIAVLVGCVATVSAWGQAYDAAALQGLGATVTEAGGAITKVEFKDGSKLGAAELERVGQIASLKGLTLYKCPGLTDQTVPLLTKLSNLEELGTESAQLSDEGLKSLASLTNLKSLAFFHLSLKMKGFTGKGFAALKPLAKLERLTVAGTPFNDEGMAAVGELTQLKEFRTWHTYQTAAGNEQLAKLTNLKSIRLGQRLRKWDGSANPLSLDDSIVDVLVKMPALETVTLTESKFTVPALAKLAALPKLKKLELEQVPLTEKDVEALKGKLSNVAVTVKGIDEGEVKKLEGMLKP